MYKSAVLMVIGLLGLAACQDRANVAAPGSQSAEPSVPAPQRQTPAATSAAGELTLVRGGPGPHVADAAGSALYALEGDVAGEGCVDTCVEVWPPMLIEDAQPSVAAGLQAGLVSSTVRPDGTRQVTYANKPLYRYAGDTGTGRTTGHGVDDQWGQWHLVGPGGEPPEQADSADEAAEDRPAEDQPEADQASAD